MMTGRAFLLACAALRCAVSTAAQEPNRPAVIRSSDGGYDGPLQSIFVPPKPGALFMLTFVTEWTRPLSNGGSFTLANERRIAPQFGKQTFQAKDVTNTPPEAGLFVVPDAYKIVDRRNSN